MRLAGQRILIVEDEIIIALDISAIVRDEGADVIGPALSSVQAVELIDSHRLTSAILDVTIADGDSLPVAVRLIEVGVPFVFHTGDPSYLQSKKDWPHAPVLNKPVSPVDLVSALVLVAQRNASND